MLHAAVACHVKEQIPSIFLIALFTEQILDIKHMGLDATKPVFRVFDKASFKPVSSATETN